MRYKLVSIIYSNHMATDAVLYTTGVPLPFKIEFAKYVTDYVKKEKLFTKYLSSSRIE